MRKLGVFPVAPSREKSAETRYHRVHADTQSIHLFNLPRFILFYVTFLQTNHQKHIFVMRDLSYESP